MPNLVKDPSPPRPKDVAPEPNLFFQTGSSNYYAKKYLLSLGRERVKCLGTTDRETAIKLKNQVIAQWEGARKDRRGCVSFDSVAFELLEIMTTKAEKTFLEYECALRRHLLPFFSGKTLDEIPPLWPLYKAKQRELTPGRQLKHDRKSLRRTYSHAIDRGLIDAVPRFRLDREDTRVVKQKEYSNDEYWALYEAAKPKERLKLETYIKTGLRAGTVRQFQWEWIDWKTGVVTVPAQFTKMREEVQVVFDAELLAKYRERFESFKPRFVFPHRDNPQKPEAPSDKEWQRIKKALGIDKKRHWFRGTAGRRAVRGGVAESNARSTLSMSSGVFARVYHSASLEDRKKFTEVVAESLQPGSNTANPGGEAGENG